MVPDVRSLSEQTYEWLKEKIFNGELRPGQRINIDSLASETKVSRTPVRDAINRLALEGLIVVRPRQGTIVERIDVDCVRELYYIRSIIELPVCEAVAGAASDELIRDLFQIQEEWEEIEPASVYRDFEIHNRYTQIDRKFHLRIIAELGNRRLKQMFEQLNVQQRVAPLIFGSEYPGPALRMAEHRMIIEAVACRDGAAAREAMEAHLVRARDDLISFLSRDGAAR